MHRQGRQPAQALGQQGRRRPPAGPLVMPPQVARRSVPHSIHDTANRPHTRRPTMKRSAPDASDCSRSPPSASPAPALATNGYFPHGYGMKAKGMGGASDRDGAGQPGRRDQPGQPWSGPAAASTSAPTSSCPSATPSAAMPGSPPINGKVDSDKTAFLVPEFGYNRMISNDLSVGVSVYGNGGMNTTYPQGNVPMSDRADERGTGQHAVRQRQARRGPDAVDHCADRGLQAQRAACGGRCRCCWATSASRPMACRRSTTRRGFRRSPVRPAASPTTATTAPPASACAWATRATSATR